MTFLQESAEPSAVVIPQGSQLSRPGVGRAIALGSQTGEDFGLFRSEMDAGSEVAAHFHRTFQSPSISCRDGWGCGPVKLGVSCHPMTLRTSPVAASTAYVSLRDPQRY
jgi:hypothetical protein